MRGETHLISRGRTWVDTGWGEHREEGWGSHKHLVGTHIGWRGGLQTFNRDAHMEEGGGTQKHLIGTHLGRRGLITNKKNTFKKLFIPSHVIVFLFYFAYI